MTPIENWAPELKKSITKAAASIIVAVEDGRFACFIFYTHSATLVVEWDSPHRSYVLVLNMYRNKVRTILPGYLLSILLLLEK